MWTYLVDKADELWWEKTINLKCPATYPNKNMELQLITMLCFHKLFAWSFFCKQAHRTLVKKTPLVLFSPYIDSWSYECLKGKVLCGKLLAQFSILHSNSIGRNYYWMLRVCVDLMKKLLLIRLLRFLWARL